MAVATFPGVFIQEIPSGVRTITGVPTAITAFVGRTAMGPTDTPVIINSFGDFVRLFGGLNVGSSVSYAVRDFFQNGGGQAVIVRMFKAKNATTDTGVATLNLGPTANPLTLNAANPGAWGNGVAVAATAASTTMTAADLSALALQLGMTSADGGSIFTLTVALAGGQTEVIRNITLKPSARSVGPTLATESQLVVLGAPVPTALTDATTIATPDPASPSAPIGPLLAGGDDGDPTALSDADYNGHPKKGVNALDNTDIFNILCIPPDQRQPGLDSWADTPTLAYSNALTYCQTRRAMLVVDPPFAWASANDAVNGFGTATAGIAGQQARNAVMYFPRVLEVDPLQGNRSVTTMSCGIVAGIMATTDGTRGVWKAPAGIDAGIAGIQGLAINLTDKENGQINPIGINALRTFPVIGSVVWGARTLRGADALADDYKYLPVRRFALFLEESLVRGLKFAVFEPNDEPLWAQIRLSVGGFLNNLFRQGAFQGATPRDAYFVKADNETTTQNDINLGIVNVLVGFAPLKPAEFVIIKLQQIAGQIST